MILNPGTAEGRRVIAIANAELEIRRRASQRERAEHVGRTVDLDMLDFVPAVRGPSYERPEHLAPLANFFDRVSRGEVVRMLFSAPPQVGKSVVMSTGCARYVARQPARPIIYATYGASLAEQKSREARDIAAQCGVELRADASSVGDWLTPQGGGMRARGVGGSTIGNPAKLFVIDDPHKDREEAESALLRQKVFEWYLAVAETRTHPDSSILIAHSRWHDDDLIGRLKELKNPDGSPLFEYVNLPAIDIAGRPLWHQRPLEWLEPKKQFEHDWWSLWMGEPRTRGERVLRGLRYYTDLPLHYRVGKGVDLGGYTSKRSTHHSVSVVMLENLDDPPGERRIYVADVQRVREEVPAFAKRMRENAWPGTWRFDASAQERGIAQLFRDMGIDVDDHLATTDKLQRAQLLIAEWNAGRVLLPEKAPWLREFADELLSFIGENDKADDQVDAAASAIENLRYDGGTHKPVTGDGSRWGDTGRGFG